MPSASSLSDLLRDVELDPQSNLVSQVFTILRELIVTVQLLPGQLISEKELAEVLSASKTPVREALIRLDDAGLVKVVPKSGTYVAPLNVNGFLEACFTRLNLEIGAVRTAARQDNKLTHLAQLESVIADQKRAFANEEHERFFELDEKFHEGLFEMIEMPGVWQTIRRSQADVYRVRHLRRIHNIRNGLKVISDHEAILKAIKAGDADAAEQALVAHIGSLDSKIEMLGNQPGLLQYIENLNAQPTRGRTRAARAATSGRKE